MAKVKRRRCKCCEGSIEAWNLWLCDACQSAGLGAEINTGGSGQLELLQIARDRERFTTDPLAGMTIEEIALLARCFVSPYSTYGGLRGYVAGYGKLPPKSLERKERR